MSFDGKEEQNPNLDLITSAVADYQQVDWQSAESSAPEELRSTIRGLRLVSRISEAIADGPGTKYGRHEVNEILRQPYNQENWGPLLIKERIGSGSFGEVFRAQDPNLQRTVALKLYYLHRARGQQQTTDLLTEGRLLARVQHPNVATVYGAEHHAGRVGIWMEYVPGVTLADILEQQGKLEIAEVMQIGRDVCLALAALHDAGIIHRDVKASNIMRAEDGRIVLMDLGVSRDIDDCESEKLYGTPLFVAPEMLLAGTSTPKSDLYSVGVLLFLMACGKYPVSGSSLAEIRACHQDGRIRKMRDVRPDLPEPFINIVDRSLAAEADQRFATAPEFGHALEQALHPNAEIPVTQGGKRRRLGSRKPLLWSLGVLISLSVILLASMFYYQPKLPWLIKGEKTQPRVLVTLFENRTGDESLEPIGLMAADSIIQGLSRLDLGHVIPFTTVLETKRMGFAHAAQLSSESPATRAKAMAATMVVDGAYYLEADTLRFLVSITDTQRDKVLNGPPPVNAHRDRPTEAIASLRQKIKTVIGMYLHPIGFWAKDGEPAEFGEIPKYEAFLEFSKGLAHFGENYGMALHHFERATAIDSSFVLPEFWTCGVYANLGQRARVAPILQRLDRRRDQLTPFLRYKLDHWRAAQRGDHLESIRNLSLAAEIAPTDGTINYLLARKQLAANYPRRCVETLELLTPVDALYSTWYGSVRQWLLDRAYYSMADYRRALDNADLAIEKRSDHMWSYHSKVRALAALGRLREIDAVIDQCLNKPFNSGSPATIMNAAARELRVRGQLAQARGYADRAVQWCQQQPDPHEYREHLAEALRLAERWLEAKVIFAQLSEENPDDIDYRGKLGTLAARLGDETEAQTIQYALEHWDHPYARGANLFWCAGISSVLGERAQALAFLGESVRQGLDGRDHVIEEIDFEPLRDYPPFKELIKPQG